MKSSGIKIQTGIIAILLFTAACKKIEPEKILIVETNEVELFSEGVYNLKGTIVTLGTETIVEHGFCWSDSTQPETGGTFIRLGSRSSEGSFSSLIHSRILPGKTYHVKAYAKSSLKIYYGDDKSFVTPHDMSTPLIDIDNNIYYPIQIGDQVWMNNNLKVAHYADGSPIQHIEERMIWFNMPWYNPAYCWYDNFGAIAAVYGNLYTWPAAMHIGSKEEVRTGEIQGVCPDGWHLPSDEEWKKLEIFLGINVEGADAENWRGEEEGGKLKYKHMWDSPNTGATNEIGFTAIPAGWRDGAGYYRNIEKSTRFWSSSIRGDFAWMRQLDNNSAQIFRGTTGVYEGISVRCVKNEKE